MPLSLVFPTIDPILLEVGPFVIRWYALAYIAGLLLGWWLARKWAARIASTGQSAPNVDDFDDLLVAAAVGVIVGGRTAYVLFYNLPYYTNHLSEIFAVWKGGMSFHGGLVGAALAIFWQSKRRNLPALTTLDICACVAPLGLLFGRLANFINAELWGRTTDVAWGVVFPGTDGLPRHPSQLYEAALEGLVLFIIMQVVALNGGFKRPGCLMGVFGLGYASFRIFCEFFREPDAQLGFLWGGLTMGMVLSIPMAIVALYFIGNAKPTSK